MRVVITGATSGLGRELALQYAADGATHVGIVGRRAELLEQVAAACRERGAQVHIFTQDVRDGAAMQALAKTFVDAAGGVDLVIANAGIATTDGLAGGDPAPLTRCIDVNVNGVINTLLPFIPTMKTQGSGHLAAVASVAGFRALPLHTIYAATKIAVRTLLDGWGYELNEWGIATTTLNPGFIVSEITDKNEFPMPFLLPTDVAVRRMRKAIKRRKRVYTFPWQMWLAVHLLLLRLPRFVIKRLPRPD